MSRNLKPRLKVCPRPEIPNPFTSPQRVNSVSWLAMNFRGGPGRSCNSLGPGPGPTQERPQLLALYLGDDGLGYFLFGRDFRPNYRRTRGPDSNTYSSFFVDSTEIHYDVGNGGRRVRRSEDPFAKHAEC